MHNKIFEFFGQGCILGATQRIYYGVQRSTVILSMSNEHCRNMDFPFLLLCFFITNELIYLVINVILKFVYNPQNQIVILIFMEFLILCKKYHCLCVYHDSLLLVGFFSFLLLALYKPNKNGKSIRHNFVETKT